MTDVKRIYFSHCMADYDTDKAAVVRFVINSNWPSAEIINPSDPELAKKYLKWRKTNEDHPMDWWNDLVKSCDALVYLPVQGSKLTAGVAQETLTAQVQGKPTYKADIVAHNSTVKAELIRAHGIAKVMTVEDTRAFIKEAKPDYVSGARND